MRNGRLGSAPLGTAGGGGMEIGGAIAGGTATRVLYEGVGPVLADSAALTFTVGTGTLSATALQATGLTVTRVPFAGVAGLLSDSAVLTFDGTNLSVAGKIIGLTQATASGDAVHGGRSITGASGLTGGGNLTADRTITLDLTASNAWTGTHTWTNAAVPVMSTITDGAAATQIEAARIRHQSSVTATAGISVYQSFWTSNGVAGGGTLKEAVRTHGMFRVVTDGAEQGLLLVQTNQAGTVANGAWVSGAQLYAGSLLGIGSLSATGVSTPTWNLSVSGAMMAYASNLSAQGGHAFTGTANTSGARSFFVITPSANTGSTAGTEVQKLVYSPYTHQFASNTAVAIQREWYVNAPTYAFATATGTITKAVTVAISGAPIVGANAAITKPVAFEVESGYAQFSGRVIVNVPNSAVTDADLPNSTYSAYLNEATNLLTLRVRYSDGTLKMGTLALA